MPNLLKTRPMDIYGKNDLCFHYFPIFVDHHVDRIYVFLNDFISEYKFNLDLQVMSKHEKSIMGFFPEVCVSKRHFSFLGIEFCTFRQCNLKRGLSSTIKSRRNFKWLHWRDWKNWRTGYGFSLTLTQILTFFNQDNCDCDVMELSKPPPCPLEIIFMVDGSESMEDNGYLKDSLVQCPKPG